MALCSPIALRSEEHTSELQSLRHLVCRLLLEKKKNRRPRAPHPRRPCTPTPSAVEALLSLSRRVGLVRGRVERGLPAFGGVVLYFFFNDTATTEIYPLSLHDALPISLRRPSSSGSGPEQRLGEAPVKTDRKSTRLNSSHLGISYAVFCLKKKQRI